MKNNETCKWKNEWIKPCDKLPKIGEFVEIKPNGVNYIVQGYFNIDDPNHVGFISHLNSIYYFDEIFEWRSIQEKLLDFYKLKPGDFVEIIFLDDPSFYIENCYKSNKSFNVCGFINYINSDFINLRAANHSLAPNYGIKKMNSIKKITRINVEERTFEEIGTQDIKGYVKC